MQIKLDGTNRIYCNKCEAFTSLGKSFEDAFPTGKADMYAGSIFIINCGRCKARIFELKTDEFMTLAITTDDTSPETVSSKASVPPQNTSVYDWLKT